MGSAQSSQPRGEEDEEEEEEEEDEENGRASKRSNEKVLEQEPEILPYHTSATPLTPQLSAASSPRLLGPSIKIWDPCNVLLQPPPPLLYPRSFDSDAAGDSAATEVFLINHGESGVSLRPDLVGGRWPAAKLTTAGERQARALAVFLNSQGIRFSSVHTSPLDRARSTAVSVCRELNFPEEQIQSTDVLLEMSQGQWEGCLWSEIYTPEMISLIDRYQPDFSAPSGESIRQVEFRMIEFLNRTVVRLHEKLSTGDLLMHHNETRAFSRHSSANSVQERDGPHWVDLPYRLNRQGMTRKRSSKSRLQIVTTVDNDIEDDFSPREPNHGNLLHEENTRNSNSIGVFTHATPIKCLLTSLLNCSPVMSHKICIDDSSVTVLQHSLRTGWRIKRLNDTSHLRLL
ncbi:2,3-bisphosphoglycerate-dependent phosphoglycerate mutase [Cocos nucifera]|nr:2,3-bisphosphoglycerate-dependent phosphoglycerate mutase [Cocos nucifera]